MPKIQAPTGFEETGVNLGNHFDSRLQYSRGARIDRGGAISLRVDAIM
jgi:hypothetical protein